MVIPDIGTSMALLILAVLVIVLSYNVIGNVEHNEWLAVIPALLVGALLAYGLVYPVVLDVIAEDTTISVNKQVIWTYIITGVFFLSAGLAFWKVLTF